MDDTSVMAAVAPRADGCARFRPRPGLFIDASFEKVQAFPDIDGVHSRLPLLARCRLYVVFLPRAIGRSRPDRFDNNSEFEALSLFHSSFFFVYFEYV